MTNSADKYRYPVFTTSQITRFEEESAQSTEDGRSVLMERAGQALFSLLQKRYQHQVPIHIVCGTGNNAGDGFVLARLAVGAGIETTVYTHTYPKAADAIAAYSEMQRVGCLTQSIDDFHPQSGVIVDCIFGIGLSGAPKAPWSHLIEKINDLGLPVIAVDIPSGLSADQGTVPGAVVTADHTLTYIGLKPGLLTGEGPEVCGDIQLDSLDVTTGSDKTNLYKICANDFPGLLQRRRRNSHKGSHGHVLIVGGDAGYGGAALMAGCASLRTGAGLTSVITHPCHAASFLSLRPELMVHAMTSAEYDPVALDRLLNSATVILLGPGLGQGGFGKSFYSAVVDHIAYTKKAAVLDADALNLLAANSVTLPSVSITPHPGEAARLLNCSTQDINLDRYRAVQALYDKYGAVSVLKGAGSLICTGNATFINDTGNPGMASGGMGDVLTGVIGGLLAQAVPMPDAVRMAVWMHGEAADRLASSAGEKGLLATDLVDELRALVNENTS